MAEEEGGASTATTNQQPGPASPSLDPPPQQGRIQATYLGRSRQCRDVSHPSRPIVSCSWNRLRTNGLGSLPSCGECGDVGEITDLPETGRLMDRGGSREGGRPVNPPPLRHLLARTPRAASAGGEGCWGPPLRRRRPPLRASSGWGATPGRGRGTQALKGRSTRSPMTGAVAEAVAPGRGGGSNPAVRTGGEGWGGVGPYKTRTDLDRVKGQGA